MAEKERQSREQLMQAALDAIPATGEIVYTDWYNNMVASGNVAAISFYRELKKRGLVKASLTTNPDGSISHKIGRVK